MNRWLVLLAFCAATTAIAQSENRSNDAVEAVPTNPEREAFFGDLHLHTSYSFDAAASGTATTPDDAYRYALGEPVEYLGRMVRRHEPLDFLAVTDHAEYLGVAIEAADPAGRFAGTRWPRELATVAGDTIGFMRLFSPSAFRGAAPPIAELATESVIATHWQQVVVAAERHYRPGTFTTLVAYEWSPMPAGAHLHRNVIFRGPAFPERPFSALDSPRPEDLWSYVEGLRARGIDAVLIPHNSNMSQGLMFAPVDSNGYPMTPEYATRRQRNERLVEIAQNKGTSETRPEFGATDEFASFELLTQPAEAGSDPAGGHVREALARGLEIEQTIGVNPFRFGLIGGSDFHSGVSATEEDNFTGALGRSDDMNDAGAMLTEVNPVAGAPATVFSAGAMTGIWAESNTREALFAALARREAFATSGTRIRVRLFAGDDYPDDLVERRDWVAHAYAHGVPMGADIPRRRSADRTRPMKLLVHAMKDPRGANLDRIQIIKVWQDAGTARTAIFDVAWSGDRAADPRTGRVPAVGNSVDLATATYRNEIGAAQLGVVWTDRAFDPDVPAIYYARVLEIPTPRWSTYLAVRNGLPLSVAVPPTIQERAWTSPVFYSPSQPDGRDGR